jgi:disulfide bond formation protein DsbB
METTFLHLHSSFRWLAIIFLIVAIIKSLNGWLGKKEFNKSDNIIAILLLSFTHLQLIVGLSLYFIKGWHQQMSNMADSSVRFWAMEHGFTMLIAITLITLGRVKSKKATTDLLKHKKGAIFYSVAFILILWAGIIKPLILGKGWF